MQTMHPVVLHGFSGWDTALLPADEFQLRLGAVRGLMRQENITGGIIYGDAQDYAGLCYVTNYIPKLRWAVALVPADGPVALLINTSSRDIPAARMCTWVEDVGITQDLAGQLGGWLTALPDGRIGLYGSSRMAASLYDTVAGALAGRDVAEAREWLDRHMRSLRPREHAVLREASGILAAAVDAAVARFSREGQPVAAVVEAERVARNRGALDVRVLVSTDGGRTLQPLDGSQATGPLAAYLAVNHLGYWVEGFFTAGADPALLGDATNVLGAWLGGFAPGSEVARPARLHPALGSSCLRRLGLLPEYPRVATENGVYSLRLGLYDEDAGGVFLSAVVASRDGRREVLWTSPGGR